MPRYLQESQVTIVHNIKGYTMVGDKLRSFEAMAFSDGEVVGVANDANALMGQHPDARYVDGHGNILLPGLIDSHGHLLELGFTRTEIDLRHTTSLTEILDLVSDYGRRYPDARWIRGRGWNHERWTDKLFPSAADLDAVVADRPVWLERIDSHAGWANSEAMRIAGIAKEVPDPEGGRIRRNSAGDADGIFIDNAMILVRRAIPGRTAFEQEEALANALEMISAVGVTAVHDAASTPEMIRLYEKMAKSHQLTARINAMLLYNEKAITDYAGYSGPEPAFLRVSSVKLFADGALGSRGAALIESYEDDPGNRGILFYDQATLNHRVKYAADFGFQVNIHAIGDRANRQVLNAFQELRRTADKPLHRHRIEHAQIVADEDVHRFADLALIASVQPVHMASDWRMAEQRLGRRRLHESYKWHSFLEIGVPIAAGSDFPVESPDPFLGLYTAITRKDTDNKPENGWYFGECLSRIEALQAFTVNAAYASGREQLIGSLEPGKKADFILVDTDYFTAPVNEIPKTKVKQTWVDGRQVYNDLPSPIKPTFV